MKQVELIRARVVRGMQSEITRIRTFVACTDGNDEVIERLSNQGFADAIALLSEALMEHMGHETDLKGVGKSSRVEKLARAFKRKGVAETVG